MNYTYYKVRISQPLDYHGCNGHKKRINISFANPGIQDGYYRFEVVEDRLYIYPSTEHCVKVTKNRTALEGNNENVFPFSGEYHIVHFEAETGFCYVQSADKKPFKFTRSRRPRKKDYIEGHEGDVIFSHYEPKVETIEEPMVIEPKKPDISDQLYSLLEKSIENKNDSTSEKLLNLWLKSKGA